MTTPPTTSPAASATDSQGVSPTGPRPMTVAALLVVAVVPLLLLRQLLRPVDDPDAFWHILSGQQVWATRVVADAPTGSPFTANPWLKIDWLSDLAMAGAFDVGGYAGVAWLYAVLGVLVLLAVYAACRTAGAAPVIAALTAVGAWIGTYASQGFRPQTVSFVLLAVVVLTWQRVREGRAGVPWWLVGLSWVWVCLHGLWVLGPLVGGVVVVGLALDRSRDARTILRLALVPVLSVVAAALTPVGPRLLLTPFQVSSYAGLIDEWQPPDLHEPYVVAAVVLLVLVVVGWARSKVRTSWAEVLLWVTALGWTMLYARTVAVGAVIAAPLAAAALARLLPLPAERLGRRPEVGAVVTGAVAAAVVAAILAPGQASGTAGMPTGLAASIDRLPRGTVVLDNEAVGGWLLLEHPGVVPVVDTRVHLYSPTFIREVLAVRAGRGDLTGFLDRTGAAAALLRDGTPVLGTLERDLGWTAVGRADGYVLLTAPAVTR